MKLVTKQARAQARADKAEGSGADITPETPEDDTIGSYVIGATMLIFLKEVNKLN